METILTIAMYGNLFVGISLICFMLYASVISIIEKERRAAIISMLFIPLFAALFVLPFFSSAIQHSFYHECLFFIVILAGIAFSYDRKPKQFEPPLAKAQIDERDTIFSREKLKKNTERYTSYYQKNPEKEPLDKIFREKPGLLSEKSAFYNSYAFASTKAIFNAVDALAPFIDGNISENKKDLSSFENTKFIKHWVKKLGALEVGITEMKSYHFYSHKGRKDLYGKTITNSHQYGIAISLEMRKEFIDPAPQGSVIMESSQRYFDSGSIAVILAGFCREMGYSAKAHIDANYEVVCPLVAKDAGLGEIGRMGILMTPKQGPRVRIAVVTTDMPLKPDKPFNDHSVIEFCTYCKKCAAVCPSKSIPFDERKSIDGVERWQINSEGCFTYWCIAGTDCTRCMKVCPYSHPTNFFHNLIRLGIKKSYLFRRIAVYMDDVFYGKKPKATAIPKWLPA